MLICYFESAYSFHYQNSLSLNGQCPLVAILYCYLSSLSLELIVLLVALKTQFYSFFLFCDGFGSFSATLLGKSIVLITKLCSSISFLFS